MKFIEQINTILLKLTKVHQCSIRVLEVSYQHIRRKVFMCKFLRPISCVLGLQPVVTS